jgi:hypothetical protein
MKKILHLLLLLTFYFFLFTSLQAQNPNIKRTWHWYFGNYAGLDFSHSSPVALTNGQVVTWGGSVSISDSLGNLLFSSDGTDIWNKNNQSMPNADSLYGPWGLPGMSQMVAVPLPGNENIYYLFSQDYTSISTGHWVYHIIDMTKDSGLGDVISKRNPMKLDSADILPSSKITAARNKNGVDIWIITMALNTNNYYAFLLTSAGLNTTPVISVVGPPEKGGQNELKTSFDGKKIACDCFQNLVISDFDNSTGIISNPIIIPAFSVCSTNGLEFSPDNKKVYVSYGGQILSNTGNSIYQVVIGEDSASTVNSLTQLDTLSIIGTDSTTDWGYNYTQGMHIGSDGVVYTTKIRTNHLGAILTPDNIGISCNYNDSAISLLSGVCQGGFPGFLRDYFYIDSLNTNLGNNLDTDKLIKVYPNPFSESTTVEIQKENNICNSISMELYNLIGAKQAIDFAVVSKENNKIVLKIKNGHLPAGIYFLQIKTNNKTYSQKIIIIN